MWRGMGQAELDKVIASGQIERVLPDFVSIRPHLSSVVFLGARFDWWCVLLGSSMLAVSSMSLRAGTRARWCFGRREHRTDVRCDDALFRQRDRDCAVCLEDPARVDDRDADDRAIGPVTERMP